jgi:hypothetical protein
MKTYREVPTPNGVGLIRMINGSTIEIVPSDEKIEGIPEDHIFIQRTDGEGFFLYDWLWCLTRHGSFCFVCKKKMPDWKPQYCCNGADCTCQGYPIEPPICSNICYHIIGWRKYKHMWE